MPVRMKVTLDSKHVAGRTYDDFSPSREVQLIRAGLAERETLSEARARAGMSALPLKQAEIGMLRGELVAMANERGISIEPGDTKADLVRKINEAQS